MLAPGDGVAAEPEEESDEGDEGDGDEGDEGEEDVEEEGDEGDEGDESDRPDEPEVPVESDEPLDPEEAPEPCEPAPEPEDGFPTPVSTCTEPDSAVSPESLAQVAQGVVPWSARIFSATAICCERLAWSALEAYCLPPYFSQSSWEICRPP
nr:hypothetical protein [Streptomyces sp. NK08204]